MKRILLISNKVMHYRVSVYDYFAERFNDLGWKLYVRSNELQNENQKPIKFEFEEIPFKVASYIDMVRAINPDIVILFLHLKELTIWPLLHWLKYKRIPVVFWTKGANLDEPGNKLSIMLYHYVHSVADRIILYSEHELKYVKKRNRRKVFIANNTINHYDFPDITESKDQIKEEFNIPFKKVVLSVGRMGVSGGRKKLDHLIRVFQDIKEDEYGLVIVGAGVGKEQEKRMNGNNTRYLGEVHDPKNEKIAKIFKMADLFSIPGHVGLGLNQAFYFGLPVITEDGGQPPEIHYLVDGRNGYIVPNNDIAELRNRILFLLRNDKIRGQFSHNAKTDFHRSARIDGMFMGFKECIDSI